MSVVCQAQAANAFVPEFVTRVQCDSSVLWREVVVRLLTYAVKFVGYYTRFCFTFNIFKNIKNGRYLYHSDNINVVLSSIVKPTLWITQEHIVQR